MEAVSARINGKVLHFRSRQDLAKYLMERLDNPAAPLSSRIENLFKVMDLTGFDRKARWVDRIRDEANFERAYWDLFLSLEYLGTLPGFSVIGPIDKGFSNFNPEKYRMSTDWTLYEEDE